MVRYFLLRFFVFAGCLLLLWLVGLRHTIPLVLLSGVISSAISLFAFRGQRERAASGLENRVAARMAKIDEHRAEEDD